MKKLDKEQYPKVIALAVVWLQTGSVPAPMVLVAPVVAFVGLMYTADWLGSFIVGLPGMRDRATNLITLVLADAPGFITALLIVVAAIWKG